MKKKGVLGLVLLIAFYWIISIILEKYAENKQKNIEYRGVLKEIFLDANNRNQYTYQIQMKNQSINQVVTPYSKSFDYVEIGDSIIKRKEELQITIKTKKSNYSTYVVFDYE